MMVTRNIPHPSRNGLRSERFQSRLEVAQLQTEINTIREFQRATEHTLEAIFDCIEKGNDVALNYPDGRVAIITLKSWGKGKADNDAR